MALRQKLTLVLMAAVLGAAACTNGEGHGADSGESTDDTRSLTVNADPSATDAALATLRRLDDHPLYAMTYDGPAPSLRAPHPTPTRTAYACTVFIAAGDPGRPVLGRNFDWDPNPALVLVSRPPDAYDSISLVDISYLGFDTARIGDIDEPAKRDALLQAAALPFDGMNEHGLAIGMASLDGVAPVRPGAPTIGSLGIIRLALDTTRTVDEALALFDRYTLDFTGGPALHYLIADATGTSAVVEFDGNVRVVRSSGPWQLMTNTPANDERNSDSRYQTGARTLTAQGGVLDPAAALALLGRVAQGHTQWSVAYDLRAGTADITTGRRYDRVHHVALR